MINLKQLGVISLMVWSTSLWAETDVTEVTFDYVGPTEGAVWNGIQQGLSEANLQGQFLGQKYTVNVLTEEQLIDVAADSSTALLLAVDADDMLLIAQMDNLVNVPVFNLNSDADALRQACLSNLLHVLPSQKMKQDAVTQWQERHQDKPVTPRAWHESFKKFAAVQLNNRFQRNHNSSMSDEAYGGWAAVKMLSDTVARTQTSQATKMLTFLKNDLTFDGQKGDTGTFRETGQLRQMVLLIDDNNKIVAEAPLQGIEGGLDSLGQITCTK